MLQGGKSQIVPQISVHQIFCASSLQHMHQISCTKSLCITSLMPQISYAPDFSPCTKFLRICTKSLIVPQISHASNFPCIKSQIVPQISMHQISHAPNCIPQIGFTKSDSPNFPAPNRIERCSTTEKLLCLFLPLPRKYLYS